jgi:Xaa-Pro dipeptidase
MRYVCKVGSEAHIAAMRSAKAGLKQMQMQCVFDFEHSVHSGCARMSFHPICSSGQDCATLHYIENDKVVQPGQMLLHDMGGKWYGYCADIAITFPVDGKFT